MSCPAPRSRLHSTLASTEMTCRTRKPFGETWQTALCIHQVSARTPGPLRLLRSGLVSLRVALALVVLAQPSMAQKDPVALSTEKRDSLKHDLLRAQFESSYITVGGTPLNAKYLGNAPVSLFESRIAPHISLATADRGRWAFFLSPKTLVRQLTAYSKPVRTPSYMPSLTAYWALRPQPGVLRDSSATLRVEQDFVSVTLTHHSNGQEGPTFLPDGQLNLSSGEFNSNFLEASFNQVVRIQGPSDIRPSFAFTSIGLRLYERSSMTPELLDRYGMVRPFIRQKHLMRIANASEGRPNVRLELELQALAGGKIRLDRGLRFLNASIDIAYRATWMDSFWLFAGFYAGQDYYNLAGLGRRLVTTRIGVQTTAETPLSIR